jgi:hypothetical protein
MPFSIHYIPQDLLAMMQAFEQNMQAAYSKPCKPYLHTQAVECWYLAIRLDIHILS